MSRRCRLLLLPLRPLQVLVAIAICSCSGRGQLPYEFKPPLPEYITPEVQHAGDYRHSVEVRGDGSVYVSGRNDFGQLGDGTYVNRLEPTKVKSAVKFYAGVAVKVVGLGPRDDPKMDLLDGPTGALQEFDYITERWTVRMDDGSGNVRLLAGQYEQLEPKYFLDDDVPEPDTMPPTGSRRRSGCRVTDLEQKNVYVVHDDASKNLIGYPTGRVCTTSALKIPDATLRMYLPRYGEGKEGYAFDETLSEKACLFVPPCTACNTYDEDEECPNDELSCNPPMGQWQHEKCRLKFTPGLTVTARQLLLTPQIELNKRTGHLTRMDLRFGMEWEAELTPITCLSGACDPGNVISLSLPPHLYELDGEADDAAAGAFHSLFLWTDSSVWTTGLNSEGQLGDGTTINRNFPKFVLWGCADVAAGYYHSVFLMRNGTVMASGRNKEGQLGDGTLAFRKKPFPVLDRVVMVAAGAYHSMYLRDDGTVWAAGSNTYGQLGDGSTVTRRVPVQVFKDVTKVLAGEYYSLFVIYDPINEVTTLWSAGLFESGLKRDKSNWSPLQFYNESEVQQMTAVF